MAHTASTNRRDGEEVAIPGRGSRIPGQRSVCALGVEEVGEVGKNDHLITLKKLSVAIRSGNDHFGSSLWSASDSPLLVED